MVKEKTKYIAAATLLTILIIIISACYFKEDDVAAEPEFIVYEFPIETKPISYLTYEVKEKITYLGEFKLTAYCSCDKCCGKWAANRPVDENGQEIVIGASGHVLAAHHSIAVDPEVIPYGTTVVINGEEYVAEDCGGSIIGNRIDVYFNDHDEALQFGVQYADIFLKEKFR